MKVRLIAVTQPADPGMTPEDLIVYCARVSSPHRQEDHASAPRLLRYLIAHAHWSPFEQVDLTVEVETSRAISAQILRHKSIQAQEFSTRYAKADLGFEDIQPRRADAKNRQNSIDDLDEMTAANFLWLKDEVEDYAFQAYETALEMGVAKECARMLLPMSTRTRLYLKNSVRGWIHYFQVRCAPETQLEHRLVAEAIREVFRGVFPNVAKALEEES